MASIRFGSDVEVKSPSIRAANRNWGVALHPASTTNGTNAVALVMLEVARSDVLRWKYALVWPSVPTGCGYDSVAAHEP